VYSFVAEVLPLEFVMAPERSSTRTRRAQRDLLYERVIAADLSNDAVFARHRFL